MDNATRRYQETLKSAGYSLTPQRNKLFQVLSAGDTFTMRELVDAVTPSVNRASVYRTIDLFEKIGIVNRIVIGWKYRLELNHAFSHHHHHATCTQCGSVTSFKESPQFENSLLYTAQELGFNMSSHTLEIQGVCKICRDK